LPKGKQRNSLIPDEVRSQFGLPRYAEHSAVFAYHFYRLIQRAENVWLLYNSEGDELGGGEVSRFVRQLNYELPGVNPKVVIKSQIISVPPVTGVQSLKSLPKNEVVMQRLIALAQRGLSPTALAMYLSCNLKFFYAQVLGIREPNLITESIDAAAFGEIIHEVLQQLYSNYTQSVIISLTIDLLLREVQAQLHKSLSSRYSEDQLIAGKNLLLIQVAENLIVRFLESEKKYLETHKADIVIQMLEDELSALIGITVEGIGSIDVKIYGKADRIDKMGNQYRIIDYKTGRVEDKELEINELENLLEKPEPSKLLQILMYAYMFARMYPERGENILSGIVSLRKSSAYLMQATIHESQQIDRGVLDKFEILMKQLLSEIFDKNIDFEPTPNTDECKNCPYSSICNVHV
jgi:CRISPR/Cas system-associated exonuclease Cas4 (RecB family)